MKQITSYITEGLRINKNTKIKETDILKIILDVIKPQSENIFKRIKRWIENENIEKIEIYVHNVDYQKTLKNNNEYDNIIKMYKDINDKNNPIINREIYNNVKNNWHFIGHHEGIGYWKNYFGYSSSERIGRVNKFVSIVYIVGV